MNRRDFVGRTSLVVVGGIFVPRFGRWFRPIGRLLLPTTEPMPYPLSAPSLGRMYYVAPYGSDLDGVTGLDPLTPFRTVGRLPLLSAFDSVLIAPGRYDS